MVSTVAQTAFTHAHIVSVKISLLSCWYACELSVGKYAKKLFTQKECKKEYFCQRKMVIPWNPSECKVFFSNRRAGRSKLSTPVSGLSSF